MRELFARWESSGQSLMAFAKAEGVSYQKLLYWRSKLGDEARRKVATSKPKGSSKVIPVRVVPDLPPVESSSDNFEVWLTNGISLDVAHGFDEHELRRLVGVLLTC